MQNRRQPNQQPSMTWFQMIWAFIAWVIFRKMITPASIPPEKARMHAKIKAAQIAQKAKEKPVAKAVAAPLPVAKPDVKAVPKPVAKALLQPKKTHDVKQRERSASVVETRPVVKASTPVRPGIPLLKFSIKPDKPVTLQQPVVMAEQTKPEEVYVLTPEEKRHSNRIKKHLQVVLDDIPNEIHRLKCSRLRDDHSVESLARRLAVVYWLHRINLLCKFVAKDGASKNELYMLRTDLVHGVDPQLFDRHLLEQTIGEVVDMDWSAFDTFNFFKPKLDVFDLAMQLSELPVFKLLASQGDDKDIPLGQAELWIRYSAIPLLGAIKRLADEDKLKRNGKAHAHYHAAIRMLVMAMGDVCVDLNPNTTNGLHRFMLDCRKVRNEFAHHAFPNQGYKLLPELLRKASEINPAITDKHADAFQVFFDKTNVRENAPVVLQRHSSPN